MENAVKSRLQSVQIGEPQTFSNIAIVPLTAPVDCTFQYRARGEALANQEPVLISSTLFSSRFEQSDYTAAPSLPSVGYCSDLGRWENLSMAECWSSVEETVAHLGVNRDPIHKWIDRMKMPARKVGPLWKFLASEIDAWVKEGTVCQEET